MMVMSVAKHLRQCRMTQIYRWLHWVCQENNFENWSVFEIMSKMAYIFLIHGVYISPYIASETVLKVSCKMPLWLGLFRFSYWIAGGLYPTGFHVVNIVLHGVVSVTFLFFVSFILGDGQSFSSDDRFLFPHPRTSLLAAVLFAVHPVHTESVSGDIICYSFIS